MPSDPFQILQVPRQASPDQIRAAYLRLVLAHHPDLNPGDALAAERFKQVQRAYEQIVQRFPARERSSFGAALDPPFVRAQLASSHAARSRGLASSAWDARSFSAGALAALAILVAVTGAVLWTERGNRLWEKSVRRVLAAVRTSQVETVAPHAGSNAANETPSARSTMNSDDAFQASQAVRRSDADVDAATLATRDLAADEPTPESAEQQTSASANDRPTDPSEEVPPAVVAKPLQTPSPSAAASHADALAAEKSEAEPLAQGTVVDRLWPTAPLPLDPSWSASTQTPAPSSTVSVENASSRTTAAPLAAIDLWTLHHRVAPGTATATESVAGESGESPASLSERVPSPWSRFSDLGPGRPIPQPLPTMSLLNPAGAATTSPARGGSFLAQPMASQFGSLGKAWTATGPVTFDRLTPDVTSPLPNLTRPARPTARGVPPSTTGGTTPLSKQTASAFAIGAPGTAWRSTAAGGSSAPSGVATVGEAPQAAVTGQRTAPALPQWSNPPWKTPTKPAPGGSVATEFDR